MRKSCGRQTSTLSNHTSNPARRTVTRWKPVLSGPGLPAVPRRNENETQAAGAAAMMPQTTAQEPFLPAAVEIGRALCREAIWDADGRHCNWMGRSPNEVTQIGGPITPTAAALGPDLYGGSIGVAWFLAELLAATGDADFLRTALAAATRSLRQLDRSPRRGGIHCLVLLAAWSGSLSPWTKSRPSLARPRSAKPLMAYSRRWRPASTPHTSWTSSDGNAGAIPALLALSRMGSGPLPVNLAERLGEELLQTAIRDGPIWTWDSKATSGPTIGTVPLAGFAHGNAGIGLALFELYAATGQRDYLDGGRGAFAYENDLYRCGGGGIGGPPAVRSADHTDPTVHGGVVPRRSGDRADPDAGRCA